MRRSRRRYWGSEWTLDKEAAFITLYEVLVELSKLTAPFTPFVAEEIYSNLVGSLGEEGAPESVHLCDYPVKDDSKVDMDLERKMDLAEQVVYMGRLARNTVNIKNRQPLDRILFETSDSQEKADISDLAELIEDELNVKNVEFAEDLAGFATYKLKPRFDLLGKKLGPRMKALAAAVAASSEETAAKAAEGKQVAFMLEDGEIQLDASELIVETIQKPGWCAVSNKGRKAALSTEITEELRLEGFLRELLNKIQNSRKDAGFQIEDRIRTMLYGGEMTEKAYAKFSKYIMDETLSEQLELGNFEAEFSKEWEVNDELVKISISRLR